MRRGLGTAVAALVVGLGGAAASADDDLAHRRMSPHRHHVSLLAAGTSIPHESERAATFGLDYEYQVGDRVGVGFVAEHAFGEIDATTVFAVADLHVTRGLVLQVGPGVEFVHDEMIAVGRLGGYYEFELGAFSLAPTVSYDISEEEGAVVYGVLFGRKF